MQQLTARMQALAADVSGSNLAWCKPAEYERWSADHLSFEAGTPVCSENSRITSGRTFQVSTCVHVDERLVDLRTFLCNTTQFGWLYSTPEAPVLP